MPFDPNLPASHSSLDSAEMRGQLNGLKALIDGTPGITAVQVDAVNTLPPGNPATVDAQIVGTTLHLTFSIPQGNEGAQGLQGNNGMDGATGPQGPSVAAAIVDGVSTLNPGEAATVTTGFDGTSAHFQFGIPRGAAGADGAGGAQGPQGNDGAQGATGSQGPAGEVTAQQLADGVAAVKANSSANTNAVPTMDTPFADPDVETLRQKFNDLVVAMRR